MGKYILQLYDNEDSNNEEGRMCEGAWISDTFSSRGGPRKLKTRNDCNIIREIHMPPGTMSES